MSSFPVHSIRIHKLQSLCCKNTLWLSLTWSPHFIMLSPGRSGDLTALPGLHLIYLNRELEREQCLPLPEARRLCPPEQQSRPHLSGSQIISWHRDLIGFFKGLCSVLFREPGVLAASSPELLRRQMALKGIVYPSWPRWQSSLGEGRKGRLQHCLT